MLFDVPNELLPYVRMSKKNGLIHSEDMPESLLPLFEKAKADILRATEDWKNELLMPEKGS